MKPNHSENENRDAFWFVCPPYRVRYGEVDRQNIVFNAHALAWFDHAITEYFRALGFDYHALLAAGATDFHVVRAEIDWRVPVRFDELVDIACRTARIGTSSITFALAVFGSGETAPRIAGRITQVHTDQRTGKSNQLPAGLIEPIRQREGH